VTEHRFRSVGMEVRIYPSARIVGAEYLHIGDHVIIDDFVFIQATSPSVIGNYVHIAAFASITGGGPFVLEDFAGLSSGVRLLTGSEDFLGGGLTNPTIPPSYRAVRRSRAWVQAHAIIGANSVILPGVTVGTGAAVGALSLVRRDVEPWSVVAGSPARRIGRRPADTLLAMEQSLYAQHGKPGRLFQNLGPDQVVQ